MQKLQTVNAETLLYEPLEKPSFVVDSLIPTGLSLFCGSQKIGKSWLIDGSWNGLSVADVFGDKEIKVGYVNGWLSTSQNMAKIFIVLSLVIILLIAPVFSGEYGGVDNIILTSKYGKTKCATAKVLASLLSAVFITTLVVIFNLLIAVAIYGTEGLNCSILFAPIDFLEGYIPFNITCGTVLKYQILLAFMSAISVKKKRNGGSGKKLRKSSYGAWGLMRTI